MNVITCNHRNMPLLLRERLHVPQDRITDVLHALKEEDGLPECVLLCTCNRFELYFEGCPNAYGERVRRRIASLAEGAEVPLAAGHLLRGDPAIRHLFRVAAGLESEIVGENEILGQIKDAYRLACHAGSNGFFLNACFHRAFRVGKRVRSETRLGDGCVGYGAAAVQCALADTDGFAGKPILVVGTGAMGESLLRSLVRQDVGPITVAGHSLENTERLAVKWKIRPDSIKHIATLLHQHDIVFSATASPELVIRKDMIAGKKTDAETVWLYDLAMPRNIDPELSGMSGIVLRTLSEMKEPVSAAIAEREGEIPFAERLIEDAVNLYAEWLRELPAVPSIRRLEKVAEAIRLAECARLQEANLPDEVRQMLENQCHGLVRKMVRAMVGELKYTARNAAIPARTHAE